ncbi:MAG: ABC transporter permease [Deltaproteobacteria bacterium]|nr:ABC transporter permease [Deltaproteobacteria bacterium]
MTPASAPGIFLGRLGRSFIERTESLLDLCALTARMARMVAAPPREGRKLANRIAVEQIYFTAVQGLWVLIPVAVVVGSLLVAQFSRIASHMDLGKVAVLLLVRELGPVVTAFIVLLRSGIAVTVEVSYMRVLNEIESMEMSGIDPLYLVGYPRVVGITVAMLCLFFLFDLAAVFGGYTATWLATDLSLAHFLAQVAKAISGADIAVGALKALFFGVIISVVSLYRGFTVARSMTAIPPQSSRAAIEAVLYLLAANIFISTVFYL